MTTPEYPRILDYQEIVRQMTDEEFHFFYQLILHKAGISRHASCEIQMKAFVFADEEVYATILVKMGKVTKDDESMAARSS